MEPPNPLLDRAITSRRALVLAQVLEPGLDDEAFDVTPVLSRILVDSPHDGAVSAANRPQVADGFHKGIRLKRIDAVFDLDADRPFVWGRDDIEVRLGPVCRRREIEPGSQLQATRKVFVLRRSRGPLHTLPAFFSHAAHFRLSTENALIGETFRLAPVSNG